MQATLKKLHYRGQAPACVLDAPPEAAALVGAFGAGLLTAPKGKVAFVLAYVFSLDAAGKTAAVVAKAQEEGEIFWLAYPKGTSKHHKGADINRDTGNAYLARYGFEGVSLVALDEDGSAMRFKRKG